MLLLFIVSRSDISVGNSLTVLQYSAKGGSRRLNWGGASRESGGRKSSSGVQGQSPSRGSGDGVPQKLEHFCK